MATSPLERPEAATAWELRGAWAAGHYVRLTLDGCVLPTIVGRVTQVAATDAYVVVDGWHVPIERVRAVGKPTVADRERYAHSRKVVLAKLRADTLERVRSR